MDIHSLKSVFEQSVLAFVGCGIPVLCLCVLIASLIRLPAGARKLRKKVGLPTVVVGGIERTVVANGSVFQNDLTRSEQAS